MLLLFVHCCIKKRRYNYESICQFWIKYIKQSVNIYFINEGDCPYTMTIITNTNSAFLKLLFYQFLKSYFKCARLNADNHTRTCSPPGVASYWNLVAASFANDTGCISAYILQVPNQPVVFAVSVSAKLCEVRFKVISMPK